MKTVYFKAVIATTCLFLIAAANSVAGDWSQWRGSAHDGAIAGFNAPATWPDALIKEWSTVVGEGDSSPALVDGKLYVFSRQNNQEIIRCLDASTGNEIWKSAYDSIELKGAARSHSGPRSSPAVSDGKVITIGVAGVLTCLNAENGKVLWQKHEFPDDYPAYYTSSSPLIVDDICIAQLGGKESGSMIAYNLDDGSERWRWAGDPPAYASPAVMTVDGERHIVALTELNLVGISAANGNLLWKTPFEVPRMSTNSATPVVTGQTVIYSAQKRGVNAVRIEKTDGIYKVNPRWSNEDISTAFNTPVLIGHYLYGLSERTNLYCLDTNTGAVAWTDKGRHERFGTIVNAGTALFSLPSNGVLTVYEPTSDKYTQLGQYKISDTPTYSYPIVSGNQVFIQDQNTVTAWTIK
jgi:outer membrane protein assembly factor BamB